jgi:hypothetical protein
MVRLLAEALVRWQHAAGPFWPYVCAAPFLGTGEAEALAQSLKPNHRQNADRSRRATDLADRLLIKAEAPQDPYLPPLPLARGRGLGGRGLPPETGLRDRGLSVLLVDLPAEPLLAAAPYLVERGWYVVPVVQRWIASPAVLPCRQLVERLVLGAWQARRPSSPRGAVLIADGERRGPSGYPAMAPGRTFDNRYEYQICRFPSTDFLRAQGVERVQWITDGASPAERPVRPDLAPYLEELLRAGLAVDVQAWPT